jgi:hypothetical protein
MRFNRKKTSIIALLFVASLLIVFPVQMVKAQTTTVTVSPQNSTPVVGQTITINIQLNNVQNLYGVDVTLDWNPAYLSLQTNQSFVGTSNGVLNTPVLVVQDTASQAIGEYHLVATSYSPATGFSGSGTIGTLTFTVTSTGQSSLTVSSTLASYAPNGGTSEVIPGTDVSGTVDATSSSSSSASPTPSSSSPTSTIPEFPLIAILSIVVVLLSIAIMLAVKKIVKPTNVSIIKPQI